MKMPTALTVMERATARRKLLPNAFMARCEENSFSAARPEKLPSGKKVAIRMLTLGHTRNAAMNQVRTTPTTRTKGERAMVRTVVVLTAGQPPVLGPARHRFPDGTGGYAPAGGRRLWPCRSPDECSRLP